MLFGEYLVLQGSKSLSFPVKYGQTLEVTPANVMSWESYSPDGLWFSCRFDNDFNIITTNDTKVAEVLGRLFRFIRNQNPELNFCNYYKATANFNLQWGLGSSSSLLSLLSQWSGADPYELLTTYFGGSGYDIACATANGPIIYTVQDRFTEEVELSTDITDHLLFVYLGKKQSSKDEIERFEKSAPTASDITEMNEIISKSIATDSLEEFEALVDRSEDLLSPILGRQKLKAHIFADYNYSLKSLGAWGGDFILATFRNEDEARNYFRTKGFTTMFNYYELVK